MDAEPKQDEVKAKVKHIADQAKRMGADAVTVYSGVDKYLVQVYVRKTPKAPTSPTNRKAKADAEKALGLTRGLNYRA